MFKTIIFLVGMFFVYHVDLLSQTNTGDTIVSLNKKTIFIKDTTYECTVITGSRSVYKDVALYGLSDSSVKILKENVTKEILIKDIRTIKFNARGFGRGALIGGALGFATGFIIGGQGLGYSKNFKFGDGMLVGLIVAIPFCLVGGGLGVLFAEDQLYDLSNLDLGGKKYKLSYLISEFSDR